MLAEKNESALPSNPFLDQEIKKCQERISWLYNQFLRKPETKSRIVTLAKTAPEELSQKIINDASLALKKYNQFTYKDSHEFKMAQLQEIGKKIKSIQFIQDQKIEIRQKLNQMPSLSSLAVTKFSLFKAIHNYLQSNLPKELSKMIIDYLFDNIEYREYWEHLKNSYTLYHTELKPSFSIVLQHLDSKSTDRYQIIELDALLFSFLECKPLTIPLQYFPQPPTAEITNKYIDAHIDYMVFSRIFGNFSDIFYQFRRLYEKLEPLLDEFNDLENITKFHCSWEEKSIFDFDEILIKLKMLKRNNPQCFAIFNRNQIIDSLITNLKFAVQEWSFVDQEKNSSEVRELFTKNIDQMKKGEVISNTQITLLNGILDGLIQMLSNTPKPILLKNPTDLQKSISMDLNWLINMGNVFIGGSYYLKYLSEHLHNLYLFENDHKAEHDAVINSDLRYQRLYRMFLPPPGSPFKPWYDTHDLQKQYEKMQYCDTLPNHPSSNNLI